MTDFTKGVLFVVGLAGFGKGMYGLGKLNERRECNKKMKVVRDGLQKLTDILKEAEKRAEEKKKEEESA